MNVIAVQNTALDITLPNHLYCGVRQPTGHSEANETNKYIISNKELLESLETRVLVSIGGLALWVTRWTGMD